MSNKYVYLALLLLVGASAAWAAPGIQSVSGTVQQEGTLAILGSGFGTKTTAAPYRWDDFDHGVLGTRLADEASGGWTTVTIKPGSWPTYSIARIRSPGSQSAYQNFTNGNYNSSISLLTLPADKPLYVSGWFYMETTGAPSRNAKLLQMRVVDDGVTPGWECRIDQYPAINSGHQYVADCGGQQLVPAINDWSINGDLHTGAWHRLESWLDQGTVNGSDGIWRVLLDGQPYTQVTGSFMQEADCPFKLLKIGHYFDTDTYLPMPSAQRYWDELYVDETQSRVEIGNAATWSACTHREIQVPSAWSASSINCTVNQGSFTAGQQAWIYVVDSVGVANTTGYPITFGGTSTDSPPTIAIMVPSATGSFTSASAYVTLAGIAADEFGIVQVTWTSSAGGSGTATSVSGDSTAWSIPELPMAAGANVITVVSLDTAGQSSAAVITVIFEGPGQPEQVRWE
jgi:hypothetical protein